LEYARAVSARYRVATKGAKGTILAEFCLATGYHRKSAIRLLRHPPTAVRTGVGRPRVYLTPVVTVLRRIWETSDRLCGKRLAPFIGELVGVLERHGELSVSSEVREQLVALSASTIDRLLTPYRMRELRRPYTTRPSAGMLKALIPLRTFGEWAEVAVGSVQVDLVAHCGERTEGFYLTTLVAVDVATSWCECEVIWGKGKERVHSGVHKTRERFPFALKELHTDNGGEFINDLLYPWCKNEGIRLTRGRSYKKNDQAYVEQKNWAVPRRLIGYDRYSSQAAYAQMQRLYSVVRLYVNFFQPTSKLLRKERDGAKVHKTYDPARTPYQRLLAANVLDDAQRTALATLYARLNPVKLRTQIDDALEALWKLTDRSRTPTAATDTELEDSVGG
jgi:hypothetical protein